MNTSSYSFAAALGTVYFLLQIAAAASTRVHGLTAKAQSLASDALLAIVTSPASLGWTALYIILGIASHVAPLLLATKMVCDIQVRGPDRLRRVARQQGAPALAVVLMIVAMATWNARLFPARLTAEYAVGMPLWLLNAPVALASVPIVLLTTLWLWLASTRTAKCLAAVLVAAPLLSGLAPVATPPIPPRKAPDIIMIGVDSLRPDHLHAFGSPRKLAPNIEALIENSVAFENAYTPQGRTFVAYMSLLSGKYPANNGVRENLYPRTLFSRDNLLSERLRENGYVSIFGLDEVRFANIDESFGFDQVVTPKAGAVEFVFGTVYDTAGTNLLQLVPGAWRVFPHISGNLALKGGYNPTIQNTKLRSAIARAPIDKPLLFLAHFCMAHVPFASGPWLGEPLGGNYADSPIGYQKALTVVDQQVAATIEDLRSSGRLENAILVVFSDHGEGLGMNKDAWNFVATESVPRMNFPADYGHGTTALEDSQSRILIAIQRYENGVTKWKSSRPSSPATLVDIFPTVLSLAELEQPSDFDGIVLADEAGKVIAPQDRPIFVESGLSGKTLQRKKLQEKEVANEFAYMFQLTNDMRFELLPDALPEQLMLKQRGIIQGHYGVANMPGGAPDGTACWLVSDFKARERSCVRDFNDHPVAATLAPLVCEHFKADRDFYTGECASVMYLRTDPRSSETAKSTVVIDYRPVAAAE